MRQREEDGRKDATDGSGRGRDECMFGAQMAMGTLAAGYETGDRRRTWADIPHEDWEEDIEP